MSKFPTSIVLIKSLIKEGKTKEAINLTFEVISKEISTDNESKLRSLYNDTIMLSGRYESVSHKDQLGLIHPEALTIEINKVNYELLQILDDLTHVPGKENTSIKIPLHEGDVRLRIIESRENSPYSYDVFLSISSKDAKFAEKIAKILRGYGLRVFLSTEAMTIHPGESFFSKISGALESSKNLVLVVTKSSMESKWVTSEYETFYNEYYIKNPEERKFIVLKGPRFNLDLVPTLLRRLQFAPDEYQLITKLTGESLISDKTVRRKRFLKRLMIRSSFLFVLPIIILLIFLMKPWDKIGDTNLEANTSLSHKSSSLPINKENVFNENEIRNDYETIVCFNNPSNIQDSELNFKDFYKLRKSGIGYLTGSDDYYLGNEYIDLVYYYNNNREYDGGIAGLMQILVDVLDVCRVFNGKGVNDGLYAEAGGINLSNFVKISGFEYFSNKGRDDVNTYDRWSNDFNYYNPKVILWAIDNLIPLPLDRNGDGYAFQSIYDVLFKSFFRSLVISHDFLVKEERFIRDSNAYKIASQRREFNGPIWLYEAYSDFESIGVDSQFTGFWLRRHIDSTEDEVWLGLDKIMRLYDEEWFVNR